MFLKVRSAASLVEPRPDCTGSRLELGGNFRAAEEERAASVEEDGRLGDPPVAVRAHLGPEPEESAEVDRPAGRAVGERAPLGRAGAPELGLAEEPSADPRQGLAVAGAEERLARLAALRRLVVEQPLHVLP